MFFNYLPVKPALSRKKSNLIMHAKKSKFMKNKKQKNKTKKQNKKTTTIWNVKNPIRKTIKYFKYYNREIAQFIENFV